MRVLLEWLRPVFQSERIIVAGYGVQQLRNVDYPDAVQFHESISDEQLFELYASAKCTAIYQVQGDGALTRVIEALIAGVPVLGNPIALRSFIEVSGVRMFDSQEELLNLITMPYSDPPVPVRSEVPVHKFADCLRKLCDSEK